MKYQNVNRSQDNATFVRVNPLDNGFLTIKSKEASFTPAAGVKTPMVSGFVRLDTYADITPCGETCVTPVKETVELRFNVIKGGARLSINKTELLRVLDKAISEAYLLQGLVPAATVTFDSATGG